MVKMNEKYILKIKREKNDNKNMNMKYKSVRILRWPVSANELFF